MSDVEYKLSNREKAKMPRSRRFWCGCDFNLINPGVRRGKCEVCGCLNGKARWKYSRKMGL